MSRLGRLPGRRARGLEKRIGFSVMAGQKREARLRARCPGHPRLSCFLLLRRKDVDARDKPGHDEFQRRCRLYGPHFGSDPSGMTACARLTLSANRLDIVAVGIDQERR
ncbi:MAG TPA: hypothetical protein VK620_20035, partial [Bradyrhizobium sp.]|nr:hypothetical protein [Bradyrhizobium sp.]